MPIDINILLHCLIKTFNDTLSIDICKNSKIYIKDNSSIFEELDIDEKMYYVKYSLQLAQSLMEYLDEISLFELNVDEENEINHNFRIIWSDDNIAYISLSHNTIKVKDLIPEKLMKICKYKKNTNVSKLYTSEYKKLNDKGYRKIKSNEKYSELDDDDKKSMILEPFTNLVYQTLSKKRKCASNLYSFLFNEDNRIVFKLYKNKFTMYDFGKELDDVESYRMKLSSDNKMTIIFNNNSKFTLMLHTNATSIKQHLSIKFKTTFNNMDEIFAICTTSI